MKKSIFIILLSFNHLCFSQENHQIINSDIHSKIEQAYSINNYDLCVKLYESYFPQIDFNNEETSYYYISSKINAHFVDKSYYNIESYINLYNGRYLKNLLYEYGEFHFNKNNYKIAIKYLSRISDKNDDNISYILGISHFNNKNYETAYDYLKNITNENLIDNTNFSLGVISYSLNNLDESISYFKKINNSNYKNKTLQYEISINFLKKKYKDVIKLKEYINQKVENLDYSIYYIAKSYFHLEEYDNALKHYSTLNSSIDRENEIKFSIGFSYYKIEDYPNAIKIFKELAFIKNNYTQLSSFYLGEIYTKENKFNFALNAYYASYKIDTDSVYTQNSLLNYSKINYVIGDHDLAIVTLEKLISKYPNFKKDEVNKLLGENYFMTNNYKKIVKYIESLDEISNDIKKKYQTITYQKGVNQFNKGNFNNSINYFNLSAKYDVDKSIYLESLLNISEALFIGNKFEESKNQLLKITTSKYVIPKNILLKANLSLGYVNFNLNYYKESINHFIYYLKNTNNSNNRTDVQLRLADAYYASKSFNKAINTYDKIDNYSNKDYVNYQKGLCYYGMNQYDKSIMFFDKVLLVKTSNLNDDAIFRKAQISLETSNFENAIIYYTNLIDEYRTSDYVPYSYLNRATSYFNLKAYDQAEKDFIFILNNILSENILSESLLGIQKIVSYTNNYELLNEYVESYKNKFPENKNIESIQYETLRNLYFNQQYNEFIKSSNSYRNDNKKSVNLLEINFYTAEAFFRNTIYDSALTFYESVIDTLNTKYYTRSLNRIALIKQKQLKYNESLNYYTVLNKISKNNREKIDSYIGIVSNHLYLNNLDSVIYYSEQINNYDKISFTNRNKINLLKAKSYLKNNNESSAIDMLLTTINLVKDESASEAQYLLAELFFSKNEKKQALETLYTLNENFNGQKYWVGKSYLLIAKIFISMDENFQAEATLNSLIDNSEIEIIREEAIGLLNKLNRNE